MSLRRRKKYDIATAALKRLLDKREMLRTEEVMTAIAKSKRSYEDIISYLMAENDLEHGE